MNYKKLIFTFMLAAPLGVASAQKKPYNGYFTSEELKQAAKAFGPTGFNKELGRRTLLEIAKSLGLQRVPSEGEELDPHFLGCLAWAHSSHFHGYSEEKHPKVFLKHLVMPGKILIDLWLNQPEQKEDT